MTPLVKNIFKKIILSLPVLFMLEMSILHASAHAGECRCIVVTSDPDYPPISWRDKENPDTIIGLAVEIIKMAFEETGIPVRVKYAGPWKRALLSTASGEVDLIAGLYENEDRKAQMDYVYPAFMADPVSVFVMAGKGFTFEKWTDLQDRPGGMRAGDSFGNEFDAFSRQHLAIETVGEFEHLYEMASAGRIAYFLYGHYSGLALAKKMDINEKIEILERPLIREPLFAAFSRNSPCAVYKKVLSRKIQEFIDAGLVDELIPKYQGIWEKQVGKTFTKKY